MKHDELSIGLHLAVLNLFRESDGTVELTVASGSGAISEMSADHIDMVPQAYIEGLIVEAANRIVERNVAQALRGTIPTDPPRRHALKVHSQFWAALKAGARPFEVRRDDRGFRIGDICVLAEYDSNFGYTNAPPIELPITYILRHEDFPNGVPIGIAVLGFGTHPGFDDGR